eukprot:CAMPEP_0174348224 /NCGR_PEP_ID=MMETSP0811_2-20130205/4611_1 /TAXON_ID=73025 ORGANISM="Eutreptiella gymnastica-like, Strain CCMP1594" /NCGR_SAMPLE_ID=MMETSP0811_2 /ASSEMBLY_ACC=CAM_ASM_000667 /LENGTH=51 /DNA_ID=CAMNT_0015474569 /DNA_START=95 /DNA_END=250 /DNA_ORIENTATION=+
MSSVDVCSLGSMPRRLHPCAPQQLPHGVDIQLALMDGTATTLPPVIGQQFR